MIDRPFTVCQQVWDDFLVLRKAHRAPITLTALRMIERQAAEAGMTLQDALEICCAQGWRGFRAEWVAARPKAQAATAKPNFAQRYADAEDRALRVIGLNA